MQKLLMVIVLVGGVWAMAGELAHAPDVDHDMSKIVLPFAGKGLGMPPSVITRGRAAISWKDAKNMRDQLAPMQSRALGNYLMVGGNLVGFNERDGVVVSVGVCVANLDPAKEERIKQKFEGSLKSSPIVARVEMVGGAPRAGYAGRPAPKHVTLFRVDLDVVDEYLATHDVSSQVADAMRNRKFIIGMTEGEARGMKADCECEEKEATASSKRLIFFRWGVASRLGRDQIGEGEVVVGDGKIVEIVQQSH